MNAGTSALGGAGAEAALQAPSVDSFVGNAEGMTSGDAFNNFLKSDANPAVMGKTDVLGAGAKAAMADPMGFAKQNLGNLAYAAAPIAAGMMVPTTTKLGDPRDTGYIRQFAYNINPDTGKPDPLYGMRAMTPVKASEFGNKTFQGQRDLFRQQNPNPYELGVGSLNQPPQQQQQTTPMASGGIVAFQDNEDQPVRVGMPSFAEGSETDKKILEFLKNAPGALVDKFRELNQPYSKVKPFEGTQAEFDDMVQRGRMPKRAAASLAASPAAINTDADTQPGYTPNIELNPAAPATLPRTTTPAAPKKAGLDAITQSDQPTRSQAEQDYLAQLMGVGEKTRGGISDIKKQGLGEALMQIGAGLFSAPTLGKGLAKGLPLASSTAAATRKETRGIEKEANEYDLNLARYRAALDAGDKDRAFKYKQAADENRYRMAMVNKPGEIMQILQGIRQPGESLNDAFARYNSGKKSTDQMSLTEATKQWNDITEKNRKRYKELQGMGISNEQDYYRFVNGQLLSATIPGQGATTRPY
jgi:hypothetical protein